jgi:hypothetical protein
MLRERFDLLKSAKEIVGLSYYQVRLSPINTSDQYGKSLKVKAFRPSHAR